MYQQYNHTVVVCVVIPWYTPCQYEGDSRPCRSTTTSTCTSSSSSSSSSSTSERATSTAPLDRRHRLIGSRAERCSELRGALGPRPRIPWPARPIDLLLVQCCTTCIVPGSRLPRSLGPGVHCIHCTTTSTYIYVMYINAYNHTYDHVKLVGCHAINKMASDAVEITRARGPGRSLWRMATVDLRGTRLINN